MARRNYFGSGNGNTYRRARSSRNNLNHNRSKWRICPVWEQTWNACQQGDLRVPVSIPVGSQRNALAFQAHEKQPALPAAYVTLRKLLLCFRCTQTVKRPNFRFANCAETPACEARTRCPENIRPAIAFLRAETPWNALPAFLRPGAKIEPGGWLWTSGTDSEPGDQGGSRRSRRKRKRSRPCSGRRLTKGIDTMAKTLFDDDDNE